MKLEPGSRQGVVQHLFEAMKTFLGAAGRTDKISEMQQALIVFTQELTEESEERARQIIHDILQPAFIETVTKKVPEIQQETVTAESPWTVSGILSLVLMGSYVFFHLFMFSEGLPEFWEAYEGDSTHKFLKTSEVRRKLCSKGLLVCGSTLLGCSQLKIGVLQALPQCCVQKAWCSLQRNCINIW